MNSLSKPKPLWMGWLVLLAVLAAVSGCVETPEREPEATILLPTTAPLATVPIANLTPAIQIAPESGGPGTAVTIWGEGWWPAGVVQVSIDDLGDDAAPPLYASAEADAAGRFTAALIIPTQMAWQSLPVLMITAESRATAQHAAVPFTLLVPPTATATVIPPTASEPLPATLLPTATDTPQPIPTSTPLPIPTSTPVPPTPSRVPSATPLPPSATPTLVINNWRGEYYGNPTLSGQPALVRDDVAINFFWGNQAPAANLPADAFSARWTRTLYLEGGDYRFYAASDDGVRVWLDGTILIDQWHNAAGSPYQRDQALPAGNHTFRVEYYEDRGTAQLWFWWEKLAVYPDWRGDYWGNSQLAGPPALLRNDPNLNFNWGQGAPGNGLPADNFSARWTRELAFTAADLYRFTLTVDDGARLYVDDELLIDEWRTGATRTVTADKWLAAGTHRVRLEYFENTGQAMVALSWQRPAYFADWKGEYWTNQNLQGAPAVIRNDANVNFEWQGAPAEGIPADQFSARWTRTIHFDDGRYRLYALADDGIRVSIEGRLLIDQWHDSSGDVIYQVETTLSSDDQVRIEYYDHTGNGRVRFWYERIGDLPTYTPTPPTLVPTLPVSTPMLNH